MSGEKHRPHSHVQRYASVGVMNAQIQSPVPSRALGDWKSKLLLAGSASQRSYASHQYTIVFCFYFFKLLKINF